VFVFLKAEELISLPLWSSWLDKEAIWLGGTYLLCVSSRAELAYISFKLYTIYRFQISASRRGNGVKWTCL